MKINGWEIHHYILFDKILHKLKQEVIEIKNKSHDEFIKHPKSKLLAKVIKSIYETVPTDPEHRNFRLGLTLGPNFTAWRRVKYSLPDRYRLFFRFSSTDKTIIYVWLNDDTCLRKEGAKTDVYTVFREMLASEKIHSGLEQLTKNSTHLNTTQETN